ncbi:SLC13 family permease [Pseudalkalibacillus sp. Hm43]|uniref:SLC13 family permease n=1 Tax=Pseudalkalibacillus sp. Hm43 TaxID=3450742 RepID=UPI003F429BC6
MKDSVMTPDIWITFAVIAGMFLLLFFHWYTAEVVVIGAVLILVWTGVLTIEEAFNGFTSEGILVIASLFIIMTTLQKHPAFTKITSVVFGGKQTLRSGLRRMMVVTGGLSSFMNNTPLVLLLTPVVKRWADKHSYSPSKLLIPLSYATIIGGMCTLLGTSTNLVVHTLLLKEGYEGLSLFELAYVGIPFFLVAVIYLLTIGYKWLPNHPSVQIDDIQSSQFIVEAVVQDHFEWVGKSVEAAGLRHLNNSYLMAILRQGECIFPVTPHQKLKMDDHLLLVGDSSSAEEIRAMQGLEIQQSSYKFMNHESELKLVEATIPNDSSYISLSIKDIQFRSQFGGVVIAVYRNGQRINQKIGSIRLRSGDMLYILSDESIRHHTSNNLLLLASHHSPFQKANLKDWIPMMLFGMMITTVAFGIVSIVHAALTTALLMFLIKKITFNEAKEAIKWDVLLVIGGAFGIAEAMMKSGAAEYLTMGIIGLMPYYSPLILLMLTYLITNILTELITNNAAAVIMFPIAMSLVHEFSLNAEPFAIAIAIAASASFSTPIGYQTNLLVYGSGQYRFIDFVKVGTPLNLIGLLISIIIIPIIWPMT